MLGELVAGSNGITVLDMEASIEHMSRGTARNVDVLLVVVEPYYRSLETAGRMQALARELDIPHVYAVANKLRTANDDDAVTAYCDSHDLHVAARIPFDEAVTDADRSGAAIIDRAPEAAAVAEIRRLAHWLEESLRSA